LVRIRNCLECSKRDSRWHLSWSFKFNCNIDIYLLKAGTLYSNALRKPISTFFSVDGDHSSCRYTHHHYHQSIHDIMRLPSTHFRQAIAGSSSLPTRVPSIAASCRHKSTAPVRDLPSGIEPTVTTLPNKIRVITEPAPGHIHTVALTIDAGTRFESKQTSGVTHLLDKLAWQVSSLSLSSRTRLSAWTSR